MPVSDKSVLVIGVCQSLQSVLTVDAMNALKSALDRELDRFDVSLRDFSYGASSSDSDFLNAFIDAKRLEGRTEGTLGRYKYIIEKMIDGLKTPIRQVNVFHLRKYLSEQKERGVSDTTVEGVRLIISSFFGWMHSEGIIQRNPCENLASIKCAKMVRKPFSDVEIQQIKDACDNLRDITIVSTLLSTGCRISELVRINKDQIDFAHGEVIVFGKGRKERRVFLDEVSSMYAKKYIAERSDNNPAFLVTNIEPHGRMSTNSVRAALCRISGKCGVENVHPHRFRRTLATKLINRGMAIQEVAKILGHEKIETTMRYIYLDEESVHNNYKKFF